MTSLSISKQIYLAVGCALALLATVASVSYLATSQLAEIFAGYKTTVQQTLIAHDLSEDVFDAQIAALRYRLTPSEQQAKEVWSRIETMTDQEKAAQQAMAGDAVSLDMLGKSSRATQDYRDAFGRMTKLTARSDQIVADLKVSGPRIREKLTKIMDFAYENGDTWVGYDVGIAQQEFMRGRFYNERYLLTNAPDNFETAKGFIIAARSQVESLSPRLYQPAMKEIAQETIGQISAYLDAAEENHDIIFKRNNVRDVELDTLGPQIRDELRKTFHSAVSRQEELESSGTDRAETTLFLLVALSICAFSACGALGFLTARQISGSVRNMADTMADLAGGKLDVVVTGMEQKHELGMMARSLEVFKTHAEHLQRSLDKERELSGLQRQFVSMVSHEFRTPLAIIDAGAQRLERRPERITPERALPIIKTIRTSVVRLTDLMESVLSAARMEDGKIKFDPARFDIGGMISEVCQNYADINTEYHIVTQLECLPSTYHGDVKLLRQVMSNLVSNAVKYSPESTSVLVRGSLSDDGCVVISVKDHGVGIPADELEKLFERFFRASTSTGIPGSGIGLHLVKQLVEMHRGTMDVRSVVGNGTTFEVRLPHLAPSDQNHGADCDTQTSEAA